MNLTKYKSSSIIYNKNMWSEGNIIVDMTEFNKILRFGFNLGKLEMTNNGHLKKEKILRQGAVWVKQPQGRVSSLELLIIYQGRLYRFIYRPSLDTDEPEFTGLDALKIMRKECEYILRPFAISDNEEIKKIKNKIPKLKISLTTNGQLLVDLELKNVAHIDINSAFPAGVVANHPEFKDFFTKHYNLRHTDKIHKAVMNYAIGASQSLKIRGNRYPQLALDAITWTNRRLEELTESLRNKGYTVLAYNTDGIFYMKHPDQPLYTDRNEGTELGQWKTDGVFDLIRFKSAGSYEYIKNGKYHPVVRGSTTLDRIKSRDNWEWGDIYKAKEYAIILENNQLKEIEVE